MYTNKHYIRGICGVRLFVRNGGVGKGERACSRTERAVWRANAKPESDAEPAGGLCNGVRACLAPVRKRTRSHAQTCDGLSPTSIHLGTSPPAIGNLNPPRRRVGTRVADVRIGEERITPFEPEPAAKGRRDPVQKERPRSCFTRCSDK
jgi:hypothetical protein